MSIWWQIVYILRCHHPWIPFWHSRQSLINDVVYWKIALSGIAACCYNEFVPHLWQWAVLSDLPNLLHCEIITWYMWARWRACPRSDGLDESWKGGKVLNKGQEMLLRSQHSSVASGKSKPKLKLKLLIVGMHRDHHLRLIFCRSICLGCPTVRLSDYVWEVQIKLLLLGSC